MKRSIHHESVSVTPMKLTEVDRTSAFFGERFGETDEECVRIRRKEWEDIGRPVSITLTVTGQKA